MDATRPTTPKAPAAADLSAAAIAKTVLHRLAAERLEPTPENYARIYRTVGGATSVGSIVPSKAQKLVEKMSSRIFENDPRALGEFREAVSHGRWEQADRAVGRPKAAGSSNAVAELIEMIVRGLEQSGQNWTSVRRREGLLRVLASSRDDARVMQRLGQLLASWDDDFASSQLTPLMHEPEPELPTRAGPIELLSLQLDASRSAQAEASAAEASRVIAAAAAKADDAPVPAPTETEAALAVATKARDAAWQRALGALGHTVAQAMPPGDAAARDLTTELDALTHAFAENGPTDALTARLDTLCKDSGRVLQHRHHLFDQLGKLCGELTASLADLAENESWVKGQVEAMQVKIGEGLTARGVRQVSDMLHHARARHGEVKGEREKARDSLKQLMTQMLGELGELGLKTGNFSESVGRYASVIEESDSLESLTGVVREMVAESRTVQTLVQQTQERLQEEHSKATDLTQRVSELEDEMKRLSDEVSTDQLTQIANRRGLMMAFDTEVAKLKRNGGNLSIGLLDIDNFKHLNDELGHAAGDEALKSLAARVSQTLRPLDKVARYGGEEFVVLLPETDVDEGETVLTRLQRSLTNGLFMHKEKQIFVTFSAGVTAYRMDEKIEDSLERADRALYEAKRTGKNRTCLG